jgi:hypothetical protein
MNAINAKTLIGEALAKPQVSPGAIHIQPLRGCPRLISLSSGRDYTRAIEHLKNINPVGVECK